MVNFMHQLDWATGCPDIWSNIILGVSLKVFLDESNIFFFLSETFILTYFHTNNPMKV